MKLLSLLQSALPAVHPPSVRSRGPRALLLGVVLSTILSVTGSAGAVTRTDEKTHVVVQGQTLRGIAKRFKVSVDELREANDLTPGTRLKVGTRLVIPVAGSTGGKRATKDDDADDDKPKKKGDRRERDDKSDRDERSAKDDKDEKGSKKRKKGRKDDDDDADEDIRDARAHRDGKDTRDAKDAKDGKDAKEGKDAKATKRPGYVRLVHDDEQWEGLAVDKRGRITPAAKTAFAKLLRSEANGKKHPIDSRLIKAVVEVSDHFGGKPLEIVSGFRPQTKTQHTPHSKHNKGAAMDFHVAGVPNTQLRDFCKGLGDVGVGYYPNSSFVHLDIRDTSAFWIDSSGPGEAPHYEASR